MYTKNNVALWCLLFLVIAAVVCAIYGYVCDTEVVSAQESIYMNVQHIEDSQFLIIRSYNPICAKVDWTDQELCSSLKDDKLNDYGRWQLDFQLSEIWVAFLYRDENLRHIRVIPKSTTMAPGSNFMPIRRGVNQVTFNSFAHTPTPSFTQTAISTPEFTPTPTPSFTQTAISTPEFTPTPTPWVRPTQTPPLYSDPASNAIVDAASYGELYVLITTDCTPKIASELTDEVLVIVCPKEPRDENAENPIWGIVDVVLNTMELDADWSLYVGSKYNHYWKNDD